MASDLEPMTTIGNFATPDELLDMIRRRQREVRLSNAAFEHICGFSAGQVDKYLGPAREKSPSLYMIGVMMDALGLSATLWIDATKAERFGKAWGRFGSRKADIVRRPNGRISNAAIARARPFVLSQASQKANAARWGKTTPEQRLKVGRWLVNQRKKMKNERPRT